MEHDVGVDDEDGGRGSVELALRGGVAGGAGDEAAVDVVAEVVLPDDLLDAALLRLLHEGLALQHGGEVDGVSRGGGGEEREGDVQPAAGNAAAARVTPVNVSQIISYRTFQTYI